MSVTDPLLGRRLGSWVLEAPLGQGGMGAVYRAVQPEIGKRVAVKVLLPEVARDPEAVQRFFAEARAVNLVRHEGVVDILDCQTIDDGGEPLSYLVMELLEGRPLTAALTGPMEERRARWLLAELASTLEAAHAHGIVHRDLKPDNVFLVRRSDGGERVKVLDFGIAKLMRPVPWHGPPRPETALGVLMGTPGFMAPEQMEGRPVGAAADVYALGVVAWTLVEGRPPFAGESLAEVYLAQRAGAPVPPRASGELAQLVAAMLAREVGARPTMREVAARLAVLAQDAGPPSVGNGSGAVVVPPTWRQASGAASALGAPRRSLGPVVALAVGLVALAGAAAGGAWWATRAQRGDGTQPTTAPPPTPMATAPTAAPTPAAPPPAAPPATAADPARRVLIETVPDGAEIWADGAERGLTPLAIDITGVRTITVKKHGFRSSPVPLEEGVDHVHLRLIAGTDPRPTAKRPPTAAPTPPPAAKPAAPPRAGTIRLDD